jgi:hypothetical protein
MSINWNENLDELSVDALEKVCGCGLVVPVAGLKHSPSLGGRAGASGSSGDGDTQLGTDYGSTGDGGGGGYKGDDNYLRPF